MKSYRLSFATISVLEHNLAEVIVDEGVIMDENMVDALHDFLLSNLSAPFSLIINKKYAFSYTFEAQKTIASLKEIYLIAVVVGTFGAMMSTKTLIKMNESENWNIRMFQERNLALEWIHSFNSYSHII